MMVRTSLESQKKKEKELVWTETKRSLNNLALVLVDEKKEYTARLETLTLKNSSSN